MRYQARAFSCGPATLSNIFSIYGRIIPEEQACRFSVDGTSASQLKAGISKHGFAHEEVSFRDSGDAVDWLSTSLSLGTCVILCVDNWSHWVAVIGRLGDFFLVADPAHEELVLRYSRRQLSERWNYSKRFRAIAVIDVPRD